MTLLQNKSFFTKEPVVEVVVCEAHIDQIYLPYLKSDKVIDQP
jgi:hypothetical protein